MILEHLVIQNFRPYCGHHELSFAEPGSRNVTLIRGLNGTGKSSIFMALKWCFSGDAPVESRRLVNTSALIEAGPKTTVETRVEVTYGHEGRRFRAIRTLKTRIGEPDDDGNPTFAVEPTSDIHLFELLPSGDAKPIPTPFDEIRSAVPGEALDYFFFDGEKIAQFAADSGGGSIREAVRHVLRFSELEHATRHVDVVRQEYARKLKAVSGADTGELIQRRENANARAGELRGAIAQADLEIAAGRHVHDEHLGRLKELAVVRDLAEEREALKLKQAQLTEQRASAINDLAAGLAGLAVALAEPGLEQAKALVDSKRRRGEIPPKIKVQVLRDWLESERCICGRPLLDGSPERAAVERELSKSMPSALEEELISLGGSIDASRRDGNRQLDAARLRLLRLNQARELQMQTSDRLDAIDKELREQPVEDIQQLVQKIQRQAHDIEDLGVKRGENSRELETCLADIGRLSDEIAKAERHNQEAQRIAARHDLAARAVAALINLGSSFENDVRDEVQREASRLFLDLIWKSGYYSVTLSPDFRLEAVDRFGDPAFSTGGTSVGEARVLSIAFIVAMQVVARASLDTKSPAVIDSPFGNLSVEPMQRICEKLPELVDQVVLFVTDADWVNVADALSKRTGAMYDVQFDEGRAVADLQEVTL